MRMVGESSSLSSLADMTRAISVWTASDVLQIFQPLIMRAHA
jgi:hypothetical protein